MAESFAKPPLVMEVPRTPVNVVNGVPLYVDVKCETHGHSNILNLSVNGGKARSRPA